MNGATGAFLNTFASGVDDAAGMKFGPNGNLYVVNSSSPGSVTQLNGATGALISQMTGGNLNDPEGLTVGRDGNLYVANGNSIVRFNGTTGAFMDVFVAAGSGGLSGGRDVTVGADGNLYATSNGSTGGVLKRWHNRSVPRRVCRAGQRSLLDARLGIRAGWQSVCRQLWRGRRPPLQRGNRRLHRYVYSQR